MIKCPHCEFEAKNQNGLRLHMKKHKTEVKEEIVIDIPRETGIAMDEKPTEIFTAPYRIKLFDAGGKFILEYPVIGNAALEAAKENAKRRGYTIEIKQPMI